MKKLLFALLLASLLNITLLGSHDPKSLAYMKTQIIEAEKAIAVQKAKLLNNENLLIWINYNLRESDLFFNLLCETELIIDRLTITIAKDEQEVNTMKAHFSQIESEL